MTDFEISMLLLLIAFGIIFSTVYAGLFSIIKRHKSGIEITNSRIDRINDRINFISFEIQTISDKLEEVGKEAPNMKIKYKKCRFTAILNNGSTQNVLAKVPYESPDDYIWHLVIEECKKFESPLQQLCWNETAILSDERI